MKPFPNDRRWRVRHVLLAGVLVLGGCATWRPPDPEPARIDVPYVFDPAINLLSLLSSAGIGVLFGFFPARRAAQMDPIEALRHE